MLRKFCDCCGEETQGAALIGERDVVLGERDTVHYLVKWSVEIKSSDGRKTPDAHTCTECIRKAIKLVLH